MTFFDLVEKSRSYRNFNATHAIARETLVDLVGLARLAPSTSNRQPLKYYISHTPETNAVLQPLTRWGAGLPDKRKLPYPGKMPTAFIVICHDLALAANSAAFEKDVGIAAQTIMLGAAEQGLGGCMIGGFSKEAVTAALRLPETLLPMLILGLGKPDETIVLEDATPGRQDGYYRDAEDVHHVIKRRLEDLLIEPKGEDGA